MHSINLYTLLVLYLFNFVLSICKWALIYTGDAGILRLIERYPHRKQLLIRWNNYWQRVVLIARLLCVMSTALLFISCSLVSNHLELSTQIIHMSIYIFLYLLLVVVLPTHVAHLYSDKVSMSISPVFCFFTYALTPFVYPLLWIDAKLGMRSQCNTEDSPSTEDEVIHLINAQSDDELEDEEREIIRSVFEFGDTVIREIMTPRVDIVGIRDDASWQDILKTATESPHSRFPVYHESLDEIIGMIHIKDLLKHFSSDHAHTEMQELTKNMEFAPETMPLNDVLELMKSKRAHQVVVVDEYGGTAGLVTLEDVLEELVGNIEDEYDQNTRDITKRADGSYLINAKILVDQLNEELAISLPESDEYDSVGGFICDHFGYIPTVGEEIRLSSLNIKIQQASPRTINFIQLSILENEE